MTYTEAEANRDRRLDMEADERDDRRAERRAKEIDTDHLRKLLNQAEDLLIEATEGEDFNGCPAPDEAIEPYMQVIRAIESRKVML